MKIISMTRFDLDHSILIMEDRRNLDVTSFEDNFAYYKATNKTISFKKACGT